jgi:hypothetical protein
VYLLIKLGRWGSGDYLNQFAQCAAL